MVRLLHTHQAGREKASLISSHSLKIFALTLHMKRILQASLVVNLLPLRLSKTGMQPFVAGKAKKQMSVI